MTVGETKAELIEELKGHIKHTMMMNYPVTNLEKLDAALSGCSITTNLKLTLDLLIDECVEA